MRNRVALPVIAAVAAAAWYYGQMTAAEKDAAPKPAAAKQSASTAADKPSPKVAKPPAAKGGKPLLLLDDDEEAKPATGPVADNSRCHVCHLNYVKEDIALSHAKADIGCAKCHGASDAHIADESWASGGNGTAPDIIYPPAKVNPSCMACHEMKKNDTDCKCTFPSLSEKKSCTDCHGKHRLNSRKCKWK
jgi:hypothetical protein